MAAALEAATALEELPEEAAATAPAALVAAGRRKAASAAELQQWLRWQEAVWEAHPEEAAALEAAAAMAQRRSWWWEALPVEAAARAELPAAAAASAEAPAVLVSPVRSPHQEDALPGRQPAAPEVTARRCSATRRSPSDTTSGIFFGGSQAYVLQPGGGECSTASLHPEARPSATALRATSGLVVQEAEGAGAHNHPLSQYAIEEPPPSKSSL